MGVTLPYTLVNGHVADADQVMANFDVLAAVVGSVEAFATSALVTPAMSATILTNGGAVSGITFTLQSCAADLNYEFIDVNGNGLTVVAPNGVTLQVGGTVSSAGGTLTNGAGQQGASLSLIGVNSTQYIARSAMRDWDST